MSRELYKHRQFTRLRALLDINNVCVPHSQGIIVRVSFITLILLTALL